MASTPLLGLSLAADGTTNWGTLVNTSITALLDSAVAGTTTLTTDADVTLSTTTEAANEARQAVILCTGARAALRTITAPAQSKTYVIINATTGGFGVKIVGVGPTTGVTVAAGTASVVAWNGSDFTLVATNGSFINPVQINVDSASSALTINQIGAGNALLVEDSANPDSTPTVIDAFGNVILGKTSRTSATSNCIELSNTASGTGGLAPQVGIYNYSSSTVSTAGPWLSFFRYPSGTVGTTAAARVDDLLGGILFLGLQSGGSAFTGSIRARAASDLASVNLFYSGASHSFTGPITTGTWNGTAIGTAYGGTNSTATPTAGAVSYGTGTAYAFTSAGTSGQALLSGGSGAPTFGTLGTGAGGTGLTSFSANQLFYASSSSAVGQSANLTFASNILNVHGISIGRGAGAVSTNTAAGSSALAANTTGSTNTAVGFSALNGNTQGNSNTAVGYSALLANTTGADNTALGSFALRLNTTGSTNMAVGGSALNDNTTGSSNVAIGYAALLSNTTGSYNIAIGKDALGSNTTGSGNTAINPLNSTGGYNPVFDPTTENNRLCMGSTAVTDAYVKVNWTITSDARDKTNFAPVPHGLAFVNQLNPTQYQFTVSRTDSTPSGPVRYGFKAQDILALEGNNPVIIDAEDPKMLRYRGESLVPVLVKAIQELTARLEALEAK